MKPKNKVIRLRKKNYFMSTSEIARQVGITRQYAKEILDKNNLPSNVPKAKAVVYCKVCDEVITKNQRSRGGVHRGDCAFIWRQIRVKCTWCRAPFYRSRKRVMHGHRLKFKNVYCTTDCYQKHTKNKAKHENR